MEEWLPCHWLKSRTFRLFYHSMSFDPHCLSGMESTRHCGITGNGLLRKGRAVGEARPYILRFPVASTIWYFFPFQESLTISIHRPYRQSFLVIGRCGTFSNEAVFEAWPVAGQEHLSCSPGDIDNRKAQMLSYDIFSFPSKSLRNPNKAIPQLSYATGHVWKCFITTAGMIETTRATNVYHKYLSQMWVNVQHYDDTDTLSQYLESGKFPKLLFLTFFYKSTWTSSPNHDYRST